MLQLISHAECVLMKMKSKIFLGRLKINEVVSCWSVKKRRVSSKQ